MTKEEMERVYIDFCKSKGIKNIGVISTHDNTQETLLDICYSLYAKGYRAGKEAGFDEGYAYAG